MVRLLVRHSSRPRVDPPVSLPKRPEPFARSGRLVGGNLNSMMIRNSGIAAAAILCGGPEATGEHPARLTRVETLCLVSCVGAKRTRPALAKDLYQSDWFVKARAYVESVGSCWFILSAKYGLVCPGEVIEPYDMTLNTMGVAERRNWSGRVEQQMGTRMPDADRIVVLAGQRYREFLMKYLARRAKTVDVPMASMRIGEQLSWLTKQAGNGPLR